MFCYWLFNSNESDIDLIKKKKWIKKTFYIFFEVSKVTNSSLKYRPEHGKLIPSYKYHFSLSERR